MAALAAAASPFGCSVTTKKIEMRARALVVALFAGTPCLGCSNLQTARDGASVLTFHPVVKEADEGAVRITHPLHGSITLYFDPNRKLTDVRVESVVQRPCEATCTVSARFSQKDAERLKEFQAQNPAEQCVVLVDGAPFTVVILTSSGGLRRCRTRTRVRHTASCRAARGTSRRRCARN